MSVPIAQSLVPIVSKAALNSGYVGTIGTGIAVLGMLSNTEVAKEAVNLLIQATKDFSENDQVKKAIREAFGDAAEFAAVEEEIVFAPMKTMLSGAKHRMDDWHIPPLKKMRVF